MRLMKLTETNDNEIYLNPLMVESVQTLNIYDENDVDGEKVIGTRTGIRIKGGAKVTSVYVKETKEQVAEEWEACMVQNNITVYSRQH